jgi:hypothetical protein
MINPLIESTVREFLSTPASPALLAITASALVSSGLNAWLRSRGHTMIVSVVNKIIWIAAGVVTMDSFFNVINVAETLFRL